MRKSWILKHGKKWETFGTYLGNPWATHGEPFEDIFGKIMRTIETKSPHISYIHIYPIHDETSVKSWLKNWWHSEKLLNSYGTSLRHTWESENGSLTGSAREIAILLYSQYPLVNVYIANWKITMLLMGKLTISMAIFNSFLYVYQRVDFKEW